MEARKQQERKEGNEREKDGGRGERGRDEGEGEFSQRKGRIKGEEKGEVTLSIFLGDKNCLKPDFSVFSVV